MTDSMEGKIAAEVQESVPSPINQKLPSPELCDAQPEASPLSEQPVIHSPSNDSPLNPDEIMEPLSVLVPLQTPT